MSKPLNISIKILLVVVFIVLGYGVYLFLIPNVNNTGKKEYLLLRDNAKFSDVVLQLKEKNLLKNFSAFEQAVLLMNYTNCVKAGRYAVEAGTSNFELIRRLKSGKQTPVKLTFSNIRTKYQLASVLGQQLETDSATFIALLNDSSFLAEHQLNPETAVSVFIPNTYEVYWTSSGGQVFEKMFREYEKFWTPERKQKAAAIPLTPSEVITLASIVDSETNSAAEKPIVAGLYLNRMQKGMYLQADPTVIFAVGDFSIKRVTNAYTSIDSPYNTYKNKGLPPGPIRLPNPKTIDAVLNYDHNDYIYMCAKETLNGEHNFAATWAEHKTNAQKYQQALNERGIH